MGVPGSQGSLGGAREWVSLSGSLGKWPPTVKNGLGCGFVQRACQEGRWQVKACTGEHGKAWPSEVSKAWASSGERMACTTAVDGMGAGWQEAACAGEEFNR